MENGNTTISKDLYGTVTQQMILSLGVNGEFDVNQIRTMLSNKTRCYLSFSEMLFQQMLTSYPCEKLALLTDISMKAPNKDHLIADGRAVIPKSRWGDWGTYVEAHGLPQKNNAAKFIESFLRSECIGKEKLCKTCFCRQAIINLFNHINPQNAASRTSERNLSNWLSGSSIPNNRETYIELCYALNLRTSPSNTTQTDRAMDANRFLCFNCGQNPLHMSNPAEVIHYYCLSHPPGSPIGLYDPIKCYDMSQALLAKYEAHVSTAHASDDHHITYNFQQDISLINDPDKLINYLLSNIPNPDEYLSAKIIISHFIHNYELSVFPDDTMSEIVDTGPERFEVNKEFENLRFSKMRCRESLSAIIDFDVDKLISLKVSEFLKECTLSGMLYHSGTLHQMLGEDMLVSRGALLLTVLAQNTAVSSSKDGLRVVDDFTEIDDFKRFLKMLNISLQSCSLLPLNPRIPLDYCVLYSYHLMQQDKRRKKQRNPDQTSSMIIVDSLTEYLRIAIDTAVDALTMSGGEVYWEIKTD